MGTESTRSQLAGDKPEIVEWKLYKENLAWVGIKVLGSHLPGGPLE